MLQKEKDFKKIQHFIPKFILNNFVADEGTNKGKLKFVDKRYGTTNKVTRGAMQKELFYEHDNFKPNEIEGLLAKRETIYAPVIKKFLSKNPITLREYEILLEFRHTTYYRSNEFIGFHKVQKRRGENDWMQRWDWRSINGLYKSDNFDNDIKETQLKAIQSVINKKDSAYLLSLMTPVCFLITSNSKKFMVSDSGSLCFGDELDGVVVIVLSPTHLIMFPRIKQATELMRQLGITNNQPAILHEEADNEFVNLVNEHVLKNSFEYYIDPNLPD